MLDLLERSKLDISLNRQTEGTIQNPKLNFTGSRGKIQNSIDKCWNGDNSNKQMAEGREHSLKQTNEQNLQDNLKGNLEREIKRKKGRERTTTGNFEKTS